MMDNFIRLGAVAAVGATMAFTPAKAEEYSHEDMMAAWQAAMEIGAPHEMMAERTGTWAMTTTWWMEPGSEGQTEEGTAERTMTLGGRVLEERVVGTMMGMPYEGLARSGFDNVSGEIWSTWTDSMSTSLFVMHGNMNEDGVLVLEGDSLNPIDGEPYPMRYEMTIESENRDVARFYTPGPDGGDEFMMMEIVYERQQ